VKQSNHDSFRLMKMRHANRQDQDYDYEYDYEKLLEKIQVTSRQATPWIRHPSA